MASSSSPASMSLLFFFFIFSLSICSSSIASSNHHHPSHPCTPSPSPSSTPEPKPWPLQFHSLLIVNTTTSKHEIIDLWYDWPKGRNFNIIQKQYGELLYDLEWTNGTSFYYTLDDSNKTCRKKLFPVGILPPNWLKGATYVGQRKVDGFLCNVWEKADFIRYFEDVVTKRPVHWLFIKSARGIHVMTFEVGRVLEDAKWQAPVYCFNKKNSTTTTTQVISEGDDDDDIEHGSTSTSSSDEEFNGGGFFEWFRKAVALDN